MSEYFLAKSSDFSLVKTFECGQCFRWNRIGADHIKYAGSAFGKHAVLTETGGAVYIEAHENDLPFWSDYFDLNNDYSDARKRIAVSDYMICAAQHGCGLRLLNQDPFETLISFIISQCNNIPRIKQIIEKLCSMYGTPVAENVKAFPEPETLAALTEPDLAPLRAGYRAKYIISASKAVYDGKIDLENLKTLPYPQAMKELTALEGVGVKVASCAALYGLGFRDAFPVDTWIKKALSKRFPPDFNPEIFAPYSGLAQQYIFYYERSGAAAAE